MYMCIVCQKKYSADSDVFSELAVPCKTLQVVAHTVEPQWVGEISTVGIRIENVLHSFVAPAFLFSA